MNDGWSFIVEKSSDSNFAVSIDKFKKDFYEANTDSIDCIAHDYQSFLKINEIKEK